ncbi:beta-mannosidase [Steroidobacter agaridevorans]|uniref:beta-mannosidase n=2 Tax=Steroidobacter agaridevorans TaxID=2695856 RepID=A0A829YHC9_9GAMM|nr:beta-mannosidase [Steroidobacter agaridevorans]
MPMPGAIRGPNSQHRESLSSGWEFCARPPDSALSPLELSEQTTWLKATVPCTAASALRELGQWSLDSAPRRFDAEDWWFRCHFSASDSNEQCTLGFDGLATLADVWLNGEHILASENMFVAHEVDVTGRLQQHNWLYLRFRSLDKALAAKRPRPRWKAPMIENQQLRWFRTTVLGRTPGWSPSAAAVGPYQPIWLEYRKALSVKHAQLRTSIDNGSGNVHLDVELASPSAAAIAAQLTVRRGEQTIRGTTRIEAGQSRAHVHLVVSDVQRWWPHTHGEPALYSAQLSLESQSPSGETVSHEIGLGHFGFRAVRIDASDGGFRVIVNDVPIFCRGACWTPLDIVSLHASAGDYEQAIEQVRAAGMNMIRIGGTMVYEDDALLEACDRHGILVWQELMFANMDFPQGDPKFDRSVQQELHQQLGRLISHASVALICGNSEVEQQAAMFGATRERWTPPLFHEVIPALMREICPDMPYWPSSAHGGSFPHQPNVGTASYYGVGAYLRALEDARRSEVRFASECLAFANVPEDATIARMPRGAALRVHHPEWKARTPRDLGAGWDFEDVRDHYVKELFGIDVPALRYSDHDRYLHLGRIATAEVMAATFAEWRRKRSSCDGGLVWFLRDLVPGAGWGIVDSFGQPKSAYYALRRALQPVAVFISDEGCNGLAIHVVNDSRDELKTVLTVSLYRNGEPHGAEVQRELTLGAHETLELAANEFFEGFYDLAYAYRFGPKIHDVIAATLRDPRGDLLSEHAHFHRGEILRRGSEIEIAAALTHDELGVPTLRVSSKKFAQSVYIDTPGAVPHDNYFHLLPGGSRTIRFPHALAGQRIEGTVRALNSVSAVPIVFSAP